MKHFILKASFFFAILLYYVAINSAINYYFIHTNFSIPMQGKGTLIAGGSGPQKSLNPRYFDDAQNIAQPAEPYVLTFWKLKKIVKIHSPDTLILGFGPYNISEFNDFKFSTNEWSGEMFKRSYLIEEFNNIDDKIPVDYSIFYKTVLKQVAFYPQANHVKFIGGYSNSVGSNVTTWKDAINRHYFRDKKELGFSDVAISYLDSIKNLCRSKQIRLILVSSPVHKNYFESIPESIWNKYTALRRNHEKEYLVIDRTREIYPDSLFLDATHLNKYGATRFTTDVVREVRKAQIRRKVSD